MMSVPFFEESGNYITTRKIESAKLSLSLLFLFPPQADAYAVHMSDCYRHKVYITPVKYYIPYIYIYIYIVIFIGVSVQHNIIIGIERLYTIAHSHLNR